jgi:hypothetical protein
MRIMYSLVAAAAGIALAGSAIAQSASAPHHKVLGLQDSVTGKFEPLAHPAASTAVTPTTGKFEFTFDVTVESTFPAGAMIACRATVEESAVIVTTTAPFETAVEYSESATGTVAAGKTGSVVTCKATIPYSWIIPATPKGGTFTNNLNASYDISVFNAPSSTISESTAEGLRTTASTITLSSTLPKDGAITAATIDATI